MRTAGLSPITPQGGYFLLADTTKIGIPTEFPLWEAPEDLPLRDRRDFAVCRQLCERAGVTAIPASAFFSFGHRHITDSLARFCFSKKDDTLNEASAASSTRASTRRGSESSPLLSNTPCRLVDPGALARVFHHTTTY